MKRKLFNSESEAKPATSLGSESPLGWGGCAESTPDGSLHSSSVPSQRSRLCPDEAGHTYFPDPLRDALPPFTPGHSLFLRCLSPFIAIGGSCSVTMETSRPPPHYCTSPQCSDLLPKDSAPHLNIPRGSNPSAVPWESFSKRELMNEG